MYQILTRVKKIRENLMASKNFQSTVEKKLIYIYTYSLLFSNDCQLFLIFILIMNLQEMKNWFL